MCNTNLADTFVEYAQEFPPNYSGMEQLLSENLSINDYEQTTDGIFTLLSSTLSFYCSN